MVFASFSGPGGGKVYSGIRRAFYEEFFPVESFNDQPPADFDERAARFFGPYMPWRSGFTKLEKLEGLVSQVSVSGDNHGGLMIGKNRYIEIGDKLFRNTSNGDLIAFQENGEGEITGLVANGRSVMPMYKAKPYMDKSQILSMIAISVIMFLAVCLRCFYQRRSFGGLEVAEKRAGGAALLAAVGHLWVLVFGGVVVLLVGEELIAHIPWLVKLWLVFPIVASVLSIYLFFQTLLVWKNGLLGGFFARARYSLVCLGALYMTWFYYFWNILGFNYFA